MTVATVSITHTDRMSFTLFIAVVLHSVLILGIGWTMHEKQPPSRSLEVTLAQYRSDIAPEEADYLAQANQEGSGTLDEKATLSTTELADFQDNVIREVQQHEQATPIKPVKKQEQEVVTTQARTKLFSPIFDSNENEPESEAPQSEALSLWQRNMEIASLEAQLKEQKQAYAKRPRRRQLTAASTRQARDAYYLEQWRNKIEWTGNKNYPDLDVFGSLTMLVAVNSDGTVETIRVLQSSGYPELDRAAKRIVRKASPFAPFPKEIRVDTDILEIIRTWKFEEGRYVSSF
ncbi:MAG: energy transducer TonB [Pseudomonadales bacterium]|nr:energy transducer TonB [Pseudomonadales bacterium]